MRYPEGFLRNSGKGKKRTYWKRCFFFRYMVYLYETYNSEDSFANMKGSHLEVEVDAAKSWADMGKVAGSLRNCQVTKSIPSWSLSIFEISSFMNHRPWLLLFKPFWVVFSLSPNRKSQLTQGWAVMFTSVFLPLSMTSAVSLHLFPKGSFKEGTAQWSREAHSVSTRVLFISAGWNHAHCPAQRTASWSIQSPWFLFYGTRTIISWDHNPSHSKSTCYIFDISLQGVLGRLSHRKGDDWLCKGRFSLIGLRSLSIGPISMSPLLNPRPDSQIASQASCQWWYRKHSLWKMPDLWHIVVAQLLRCVWLLVTPWTVAHQASLFLTISLNLL